MEYGYIMVYHDALRNASRFSALRSRLRLTAFDETLTNVIIEVMSTIDTERKSEAR